MNPYREDACQRCIDRDRLDKLKADEAIARSEREAAMKAKKLSKLKYIVNNPAVTAVHVFLGAAIMGLFLMTIMAVTQKRNDLATCYWVNESYDLHGLLQRSNESSGILFKHLLTNQEIRSFESKEDAWIFATERKLKMCK